MMTWASNAQGEREGPNASSLSRYSAMLRLISESGLAQGPYHSFGNLESFGTSPEERELGLNRA